MFSEKEESRELELMHQELLSFSSLPHRNKNCVVWEGDGDLMEWWILEKRILEKERYPQGRRKTHVGNSREVSQNRRGDKSVIHRTQPKSVDSLLNLTESSLSNREVKQLNYCWDFSLKSQRHCEFTAIELNSVILVRMVLYLEWR